jgi:hypothetical protein
MGAHPPDSTAGPAGGRLGADLAAHVEAIVHAAEREARVAERAIAEHRRSAEQEVQRYLAAARLQVDAESAARAARIETLSAAAGRLADELEDAVAALARELQSDERDAATRLARAPWPAPQTAEGEPSAASTVGESAAPTSEPAAAPVLGRASAAHDAGAPVSSAPTQPTDDGPQPSWSRVMPAPAAEAPHAADGAPVDDANANGEATLLVPSAARLVAIEMAVGGSSRAEVEQHLRAQLGVAEPEPLLDDVFGVASHAGSRLAWGEP